MTFKDQKQVASPSKIKSRINTCTVEDAGETHPLWAMLEASSTTWIIPWRRLSGAVRAGVYRIAGIMHHHNIPYGMYVDWLKKFNKLGLVRHPMSIVGCKIKPNGAIPIFAEFMEFNNRLQHVLETCPNALRVNDAAYRMYPGSYIHGPHKFLYSIDLMVEALKTRTSESLITMLSKAQDIESFWHLVGDPRTPHTVPVVDLSGGKQDQQAVKTLSDELRIRTGVVQGFPNPKLSRYFKTDGKLNAQGLKVITGEQPLKERS